MANLKTVLLKIITNADNFCYLCLRTLQENDKISLQDEVVLENKRNVKITELLTFVAGEYLKNMELPQSVCRNCTKSLIISYNFIKRCHETAKLFCNAVENLNHLLNDEDGEINYKSIFICFDNKGDIQKKYYDTKSLYRNSTAVLHRFQTLSSKGVTEVTLKTSIVLNIEFDEESISSIEPIINRTDKHSQKIKIREIRCETDQSSYKCKMCQQTYSTATNLRKHYYRVHAPKKYKCSLCTKIYGSATILKIHKENSHSNIVCCQCGKIFHSKYSLDKHEQSHKLKHVCQHCGKVYKTIIPFKNHVDTQCGKNRNFNKEPKFICDYCGKQYVQKSALCVHMQFEHGNWKCHVCEWCNKKFHSVSKLNEHVVTHTKEKKFGCDVCGGMFVTKATLLYHKRTHSGEKPYKCTYCKEAFLSASRRSEHVQCHHTPAMEVCDVCNKKFKRRNYLLNHKKRHLNPNSRLHSYKGSHQDLWDPSQPHLQAGAPC